MMVRASRLLSTTAKDRGSLAQNQSNDSRFAGCMAILEAGSPDTRVQEPSPALERLGKQTELIWQRSWIAVLLA